MQYTQWMARKFGPAASTVVLAAKGGAIIKGVFISAKGTTPSVIVYDNVASVAASAIIPSVAPAALGLLDFAGIGCGRGLTVKVASCTGSILFQPNSTA